MYIVVITILTTLTKCKTKQLRRIVMSVSSSKGADYFHHVTLNHFVGVSSWLIMAIIRLIVDRRYVFMRRNLRNGCFNSTSCRRHQKHSPKHEPVWKLNFHTGLFFNLLPSLISKRELLKTISPKEHKRCFAQSVDKAY